MAVDPRINEARSLTVELHKRFRKRKEDHFDSITKELDAAIGLLSSIDQFSFDWATQDQRNQISGRLNEYIQLAVELASSTLESLNEEWLRNMTVQFSSSIQNLSAAIAPLLSFAIARDYSNVRPSRLEEQFAGLEERIGEVNQALISRFGQFGAQVDDLGNRVNQTVEYLNEKRTEMEAAIASVGVERYQSQFGTAAEEYGRASTWWLCFAFLFSAIAVILPLALLYKYPFLPEISVINGAEVKEWINGENVARVLGKAVAIFSLFYIASVCLKNYRANKHLQVVNSHRSLALLTFQTFVEAASGNEDVKNAVLLETTRSIFAPGATGYDSNTPDGPDTRLIEILTVLRGK